MATRKQRKTNLKYKPKNLTKKDSQIVSQELRKSIRMYKKNKYHTRKRVKSFKSKPSRHISKAKQIYDVKTIEPSIELARKTKCSKEGLDLIMKKGQGAYFSSGSRPNQTAHSWGVARLASSITGGKSALVDKHYLVEHCKPSSPALKFLKKAEKNLKLNTTPKVNL